MVRNSIPVFPSLYSSGQAHIQFNFGHTEFLFSKANLFRYGLVSTSTLSELPPAYENDIAPPINTFNNPNTSAPQYPL
ncbi:hypothetical protein K502DRAFT_324972 [Neoconidiobolus thromboides FSU 785]|nr:hypothetical protein K502DRAFT_324972 [Neoconidiobolus thromboides FSU 785]